VRDYMVMYSRGNVHLAGKDRRAASAPCKTDARDMFNVRYGSVSPVPVLQQCSSTMHKNVYIISRYH
jgi:hypothetical protein